jgi:hypothetical protein
VEAKILQLNGCQIVSSAAISHKFTNAQTFLLLIKHMQLPVPLIPLR